MKAVSHKVVLGLYDRPLVSDAAAAEIVLVVGKLAEDSSPAKVAARLSYAAQNYASAYEKLAGPDLKKQKADAEALALACRGLLKAAGIVAPPARERDLAPYVASAKVRDTLGRGGLFALANLEGHESGADAVADALQGVADLERWARKLADWRKRKKESLPSKPDGRPRNTALNKLFDEIEEIYREEWDWIAITHAEDLDAMLKSGEPWPPPITALNSSKESVNGADWKEVWRLHGLDPATDFNTGSNVETGEARRTGESVLQDTNAPRPLRFFRLLWEVMFRLDERGIPVGELKPGAVAASWRRRKEGGGEKPA